MNTATRERLLDLLAKYERAIHNLYPGLPAAKGKLPACAPQREKMQHVLGLIHEARLGLQEGESPQSWMPHVAFINGALLSTHLVEEIDFVRS